MTPSEEYDRLRKILDDVTYRLKNPQPLKSLEKSRTRWSDCAIHGDQAHVSGMQPAPEETRPHIRFAFHHRGRTWVLACSERIDTQGHPPLHSEVPKGELISGAIALLWHLTLATPAQATMRLCKRLYRQAFLSRDHGPL